MKCSRCKNETIENFTSKDNKVVCRECLEKEIYKERKKILKKYKKDVMKMNYLLIGIFIGFGISYFTVMVILMIKELIK